MTRRDIPRIFDFSFFESIANPVFVMDKYSTWLYCNKAFEIFSGLTSEAIKSQIPIMRHFLRSSAAERCTRANIHFFANNLQGQFANIAEAVNSPHIGMQIDKLILRNRQNCASGFIGIIRMIGQAPEFYPGAQVTQIQERGKPHPDVAHFRPEDHNPLTPKELQILNLIALGYSTKKIAALLSNSVHTISDFHKSIYLKLNSHTKMEAVNTGKRRGLLKD